MRIPPYPSEPNRLRGWSTNCDRRAFSLIELFTVVAIIGIISALAVPALNRINDGQRMGRAIAELTGLLEYARTEAMSRSTYVWVGFKDRANEAGNAELVAMVFASRDGTANAASGDIEPLTKMLRLERTQLASKNELSQEVRSLLDSTTTASLSSNASTKALPTAQGTTFDRTLTFTPGGEAMLAAEPILTTGFDNVIDISLRPMRGTAVDPSSPDQASIWLHGASGRLQVYRLQ